MTAQALGGVQRPDDPQCVIDPAEFDLYALIREELATNPDPDPHAVAREVLKAIPDEHLSYVAELGLVRIVRAYARIPGRPPVSPGPSSSPRWDDVARLQRRLRDRLEIGSDEREWRFLADCTRGDLLRAATMRRVHAAATIAKAEELERIADALTAHDCETVGELPSDVLAEVLS